MAMPTHLTGALAFLVLAAIAPVLPAWLVSLATISLANALVVLGLIVMWRAGLVSFGLALFWLVLGVCALAALAIGAYFRSVAGALALPIRDNEIRVEFLGISVNRLIHVKLAIAGALGGAGGALAALAISHVDPEMAYWTTSGGFVFVTILAGAGSVAAAFVGSFVFQLVRSIAVD